MEKITRRLFLRNTAVVGAVGTAIAAPAIAAEPARTPHEQALWHIRELERLVLEQGAREAAIFVCGHGFKDGGKRSRALFLADKGRIDDTGQLFGHEGVRA